MTVTLRLLGGFDVTVDGVPVVPEQWTRRQAASLVKVLALAPGRRLHREQLIEALWPGASVEAAGPRLHKAAHYARRALGGEGSAVLLRNDMVALLPEGDVSIDVDEFRARAREALEAGTPESAQAALAAYGGPLLPEDVYEPGPTRRASRSGRSTSTCCGGPSAGTTSWPRTRPTRQAHLALIRDHMDSGDVRSALRQFERLDHALLRELGTTPARRRSGCARGCTPPPAARSSPASDTARESG